MDAERMKLLARKQEVIQAILNRNLTEKQLKQIQSIIEVDEAQELKADQARKNEDGETKFEE